MRAFRESVGGPERVSRGPAAPCRLHRSDVKVCVFGAGAVGGYLAARLLQAGHHEVALVALVALVARGEQLRAIAANG